MGNLFGRGQRCTGRYDTRPDRRYDTRPDRRSVGRSDRRRSIRSPIVPEQDPLLRAFNQRTVQAELSRDFESLPRVLGTGFSGVVRLARHIATDQRVAVKEFNKKSISASRMKMLQSEVGVHLRLDHPNICRLLYAYEGKNNVWLVMELCDCELYKRLCERKVYGESDAQEVMLQMLQAMNYLHTQNIVHRDLKLENWMCGFKEQGEKDRVKLIDFGFSRRLVSAGETLDLPCGTLHYASPEVLAKNYTRQCDMWSLGVIGYMLLLGRPPFGGKDDWKVVKAIRSGTFPKGSKWNLLSPHAQDFITKLLRIDETKRMDTQTALEHPWITNTCSSSSSFQLKEDVIGTETLKSLRQFAQGSHLRRAALTVLAYSFTSQELQDLEQTFFAFDKNKQGTITMEQLAEVMKEHHLEVSNEELQRIFQSVDIDPHEEIHYTPFIAAMLATRISYHEDKVRTAFEAFDPDRTGYITAETLAKLFNGLGNKTGSLALTQDEAEQWIREVDYKGNGVIDFDEFLTALKGKHIWAFHAIDENYPIPEVRVYNARPRSVTAGEFMATRSKVIRHNLAYALIDNTKIEPEALPVPRSKSLPAHRFIRDPGGIITVRDLQFIVDDEYF